MATADRKRREERVKLLANATSNLGVAFIVGGAIGPALLGRANLAEVVLATFAGFGLHLGAQGLLHYVAPGEPEEAV